LRLIVFANTAKQGVFAERGCGERRVQLPLSL